MKVYEQICPIALALDEVGERWSLMIVRDLTLGPLRFSDLLATNPGIGPNLLTQRLKGLAERGVVTRRALPPPAASTVYELTEKGRDLLPVLVELARWGANYGTADLDAEAIKEAVESKRPLVLARGGVPGEGKFVVSIDGVKVGITVADGDFEVTPVPPRKPQATVSTSIARMAGVALGVVPLADALAAGDLVVEGDVAAATAVLEVFLTPLPVPVGQPSPDATQGPGKGP